MNIKASGRSALIIAAGFWVCLASPLQAAEDADGGAAVSTTESAAGPPVALNKFTKKSRHWKRQASSQRKSVKVASRASTENAKPSRKNKAVDADAAMKDDDNQSAIPLSVANANAQLAAADLPADMTTISTKASNMLRTMAARQGDSADPQAPAPAADTELVSADQLNDVDRALSDSKSDDKDKAPAATLAMAVAQTPVMAGADDSTWGQTSLIGKIFIAFGSLLTLASAARMFMA
ncbi:MAG TPA: hypothetical protein VGO49_15430 [Bradyrhizobium sp.]|jgi:hypothetical protein|nr:hypothetical protein [Bradyrhizobium sp.]